MIGAVDTQRERFQKLFSFSRLQTIVNCEKDNLFHPVTQSLHSHVMFGVRSKHKCHRSRRWRITNFCKENGTWERWRTDVRCYVYSSMSRVCTLHKQMRPMYYDAAFFFLSFRSHPFRSFDHFFLHHIFGFTERVCVVSVFSDIAMGCSGVCVCEANKLGKT